MNDTTAAAHAQQLAIIYAKTAHERAMMGIEMINTVRQIVENTIRVKEPNISQKEMLIAVIKRYYATDFTAIELSKIIQSFE
jgi:hypothetical protein